MKPVGRVNVQRAQPYGAKTAGGPYGGRGTVRPPRKQGGGGGLWLILLAAGAVIACLVLILCRPSDTETVPGLERPRPADLDFIAADGAVQQYLANLSDNQRRREQARINLIRELRTEWMHSKFAYDAGKEGVRLQDGRTIYGPVMANENGMVVLQPGGGQPVRLQWGDVTLEQYLLFLEAHVRQRVSRVDAENGTGAQAAGRDCLRLAIAYDWYGRPEDALRQARDARRLDPSSRNVVESCFPALKPDSPTP
jgi:hypothetical protein